jgi:hypothetical protein
VVVSSSSRRYSVRLPYAEDWKIESSDDAPLFAESPGLRLQAFLSDDDSGQAGFEEEVALLLHLYLSSKAFGTKAKPQAIQKVGGLLVLEATYKPGGELKEEIYLAATARQAPWQPKREYRTLARSLKSPKGGPLTPAQVKELARQDFRQSAGP